MNRSVVERKKVKDLKQGDILFQNIGKMTRGGYLVDDKIRLSLEKHQVLFISTLQFLQGEKLSEEEIKSYLFERSEIFDAEITDIREEIMSVLKEIYIPFSESNSIFDNKKRKRQIVAKALFDPQIKELFQADIDAGSLALIPPHRLLNLQSKLLEAYRYFNGFKRKDEETKGQTKVFPRQNYASVRLHTIYHPSQDKIETLGDAIIWHAIDTCFYFLATLANINKIRNAQGRPLSSMKYLLDGNVETNGEFCYRSDIIISAGLGALLAPLGYMHSVYLPILNQKISLNAHEPIAEETLNLLKKVSLVSFNLIRNRDDISPITKLIVRKQDIFQDGSGENYLKDDSPLHEFVRLYQTISAYDTLTHPFLANAPVSRQDAVDYLEEESVPYDEKGELSNKLKKPYDKKMLEEFLSVLAPYELFEIIYLVDKENPEDIYYKGFVLNYNNDSTIPLISLLYDYKNQKEFAPREVILDLMAQKIFILKEGKLQKQLSSPKLEGLKIFDWAISPANLKESRNPLIVNLK